MHSQNNQKRKHRRLLQKRFFLIFLPLATLIILSSITIYIINTDRKLENLYDDERDHVFLLTGGISTEFTTIVSDLLILAKNQNLQAYLSTGDIQYYELMSQELLFYIEQKGIYNQIRFLDEVGMEIFRVDFNNNTPILVPEDQLQDKGNRYYFQDTFQLEEEQVFVSPLDLNIEFGEVVQPNEPMIRFGTPVFDSEGQKRGIILLNYFGANLIQYLEEFNPNGSSKTMLLNADGYWLTGPIPEDEWGFMFANQDDRTFGNAYPEAWQHISSVDNGQFQNENGLFTFITVYPLLESWSSSSGSGEPFIPSATSLNNSSYFWTIVLQVLPDSLNEMTRETAIRYWIMNAALVIVAAVGSWIGAQIREKRKRAEETIKTLSNAVEQANDMIFITDASGTIEYVNPAFEKITGYSKEQALGEKPKILQSDKMPPIYYEKRWDTLLAGGVVHDEMINKKKNGELFYYDQTITPLLDINGKIINFLSTGKDVTERKQAEEELEKHREHLEDLVNDRTQKLEAAQEQLIRKERLAVLGELAGGIGHDLRNPLMSIVNAVYYLNMIMPDADDKTKEYLNIITSEASVSGKIITDLLDFARINLRDKEMALVSELVEQVLEKHALPENVKLKLELPTSLPSVFVDPDQIVRVLSNLVVNAFQAMPEGGTLTIEAKKDKEKVRLSIIDSGVGIPEENIKKLFEPLFSTKERGIGLGLAISKKLIEANQGIIEVESEEGQGTTFMLILPTNNNETKA